MFSVHEVFANFEVALRKESVDRNKWRFVGQRVQLRVALRKESVDRNLLFQLNLQRLSIRSLSARRAWIEIVDYIIDYAADAVALRKESVDRNVRPPACPHVAHKSLSARRAWIEMHELASNSWR